MIASKDERERTKEQVEDSQKDCGKKAEVETLEIPSVLQLMK